jgi:hypothetical protein
MYSMLTALSRICFALGFVLLGVSGYLYYLEEPWPPASIDEPVRELGELGELPVGVTTIEFPIHVHTRKPIRIVGLPQC